LPLVIIALAACETTVPEHLAALRADPLATFELPGADLMESELDDAGFALGDPVAASITHRFSIMDGADPDRVRNAAIAKAIESGWGIEDPMTPWWKAQRNLRREAPRSASTSSTRPRKSYLFGSSTTGRSLRRESATFRWSEVTWHAPGPATLTGSIYYPR
jgi:hypothetical protein